MDKMSNLLRIFIIILIQKVYIFTYYTLENAKIYDYYKNSWKMIDNAIIEYKNDEKGILTYLDLYNSESQDYYSKTKYPDDFDESSIKIEFYSEHDLTINCGEFYPEINEENSNQYIAIYNNENLESDKYIKRSSFDYILKIALENEEKFVTFRFNNKTLNISEYKTCFHDLNFSNTYFDVVDNKEILGPYKHQLGTIELRTTDNYLYNKEIDLNDFFQFIFDKVVNSSFKINPRIISGIYDIDLTLNELYNGSLTIMFKGNKIKTINITSLEKNDACYAEFEEPNLLPFIFSPEPREYYY